jgi:hypothetical protein
MQETDIRRIEVLGQPGQKARSYLQNNQSKKGLEAWLKLCVQTPVALKLK